MREHPGAAKWSASLAVLCALAFSGEDPPAQWEWQGRGLPELKSALQAPGATARAEAVLALGVIAARGRLANASAWVETLAPEKLAELLLASLQDKEARIRGIAVSALGLVLVRAPEARTSMRQALLERLQSDLDAGVRANAVDAFYRHSADELLLARETSLDRMWPELAKAARDGDSRVRRRVASVLNQYNLGKPALNELFKVLLEDADAQTAVRALEAAEKWGPACAGLLPVLLEQLGKNGCPNPGAALRALKSVGWEDASCLPALAKALRLHGKGFHSAGLRALGERGAPAVPLLREFLGDPETCLLALAELVRIGAPDASVALPEIRPLLADAKLAERARSALWSLTLDAEELSAALLDPLPLKRSQAFAALATRKTIPAAFVPALKSCYEKLLPIQADARPNVLRALVKAGPESAGTVVALLDEKEVPLQPAFIEALLALGPKAQAAIPYVERVLQNPNAVDAPQWRRVLLAIAPPELFSKWLADKDDGLAEEIRKALLIQKTAPSPDLFSACSARFARAKEQEKSGWADALVRTATLDQLLGLVRPGEDAALQRSAFQELGRRGGAAAPALEALKKIDAGAKVDAQRIQKQADEQRVLQTQAQSAVAQIERALAAEKAKAKVESKP